MDEDQGSLERLDADRFQILDLLGRGGMSRVYKARDLAIGEVVAIKVLDPRLATDAQQLERFRREIRISRRIQHPNVLSTYEFGLDGKTPYVVMEYVDGETLSDRVAREGALDLAVALEILRGIAAGLGAAHQRGIVHRDLKPSNVLLAGPTEALLADFGLARAYEEPSDLTGELMIGSPHYMAPEQICGEPVGPPADIHALGLILFKVLTGSLPFPEDRPPITILHAQIQGGFGSPGERRPELTPAVDAFFHRCTARAPADRFADGLEALAALEALEEAETPPSHRALRILVVDDSKLARKVVRKQLGELGHDSIEADSGRAGLQVLAEEEVDLVVLDLQMPEMDGFETAMVMKSQKPRLPIIIMTALEGADVRTLADLLHADAFISKPLDPGTLETKIEELCPR